MSPEDVKRGLDSLTMVCKGDPKAFGVYLNQNSILYNAAGYDVETVLLTSLAKLFTSDGDRESLLLYIKMSVPLLFVLNSASRYASRMEDPSKFTWEEYFANLTISD